MNGLVRWPFIVEPMPSLVPRSFPGRSGQVECHKLSVCAVCVGRVISSTRRTSLRRSPVATGLVQLAIAPRDRCPSVRLTPPLALRLPDEARDGHCGRTLRPSELDTSLQGDRLRGAIDVGAEIATSDLDSSDLAAPPSSADATSRWGGRTPAPHDIRGRDVRRVGSVRAVPLRQVRELHESAAQPERRPADPRIPFWM